MTAVTMMPLDLPSRSLPRNTASSEHYHGPPSPTQGRSLAPVATTRPGIGVAAQLAHPQPCRRMHLRNLSLLGDRVDIRPCSRRADARVHDSMRICRNRERSLASVATSQRGRLPPDPDAEDTCELPGWSTFGVAARLENPRPCRSMNCICGTSTCVVSWCKCLCKCRCRCRKRCRQFYQEKEKV